MMHVSAYGNQITVHGVESAGHSDRDHLKHFDGATVKFVANSEESKLVISVSE